MVTPPKESITFSGLRQHLSQMLTRLGRRETRYVIVRDGKPVAAVVSIADLQQLEKADQQLIEGLEA